MKNLKIIIYRDRHDFLYVKYKGYYNDKYHQYNNLEIAVSNIFEEYEKLIKVMDKKLPFYHISFNFPKKYKVVITFHWIFEFKPLTQKMITEFSQIFEKKIEEIYKEKGFDGLIMDPK